MTSMVWSEPLTGSVTGGSPLVQWFGLLVRWLRGALASSDASGIERMKSRALAIGAPVLAATSREDLTERLDAAWRAPELGLLIREAMPAMKPDAFASLAISAEALDEMKPILGERPVTIIAGTAPLISVCGGVLAHLLANHDVPRTELPADWYEILSGPGIHSTIKRGLLGSFRASVALMAISHAVFQGQRLEPWLALGLAESYRDELYWITRLYASIPAPIEVPESVIPLHDRFDLDRLQAEVDANEFLWNNVAELAGGELSLCEVPDDD